jgi:hypothetical protein
MSRPRKPEVIKAAELVCRQSQRDLKQLAKTLTVAHEDLPTRTIILKPGEKLSDVYRDVHRHFPALEPISPAARRMARFIKWKMAQLAAADAKRGRVPSERTMLNRSKWVLDTAFIIELGRPGRLQARETERHARKTSA